MKSVSRLFVASVAILTLTGGAQQGVPGAGPAQKASSPKEPEAKGVADVKRATWKEVERLEGEQKLEEARKAVEAIRAAARAAGNGDEWTRALIREVQLRTGLHEAETAVRFLKEQEWPKGALNRASLDLFYAESLVNYVRAYGWETGQRERVEAKGPVDLKAWTRDQIWAEAARAFAHAWSLRESLGAEPDARLPEFVQPNTYPAGIRPTLRDAVSYLFADFLADSSGWRPEESNELHLLDAGRLAAGDSGAPLDRIADPAVHPLRRMTAVLFDLAAWHRGAGRKEAELEAVLERTRRLHAALSDAKDRLAVRKELERQLAGFRSVAWWATGQAQLAEFVRGEPASGSLVRAREIAAEGAKAYPGAPGGKMCRAVVDSIEEPSWRIAAMASDGAAKRSIQVTHRNQPALHFRAWAVDLEERVAAATDYNTLPDQKEVRALLGGRRPDAEWKVDLPDTPDFKEHRTYAVPPMKAPGLWVVAASGRADFGESGNQVTGVSLVLGDLVLAVRTDDEGGASVQVVSGSTGRPRAGVAVSLWKKSWREPHRKVVVRKSGEDGRLRFPFDPSLAGSSAFLIARDGADVAFEEAGLSFARPAAEGPVTASLVYTDRSAYRPQQKMFWKVLAYRGSAADARFAAYPEAALTVTLVDPNGETVESASVKTNGYGTAAGEFRIPAGRLLGGWQVRSSLAGATSVRVEEYKRPTFEVSFKETKSPLRLNRAAVLTGEARYYFGLPVTNGSVKWRVTREPVTPWWWGWYGGWSGGRTQAQTIVSGTSPLKEDGSFDVAFTPEADERSAGASRGVSFRFVASADVTDEGGETRSATRSVRLGAVSVEARVDLEKGFFPAGSRPEARFTRASLDGSPRPGTGSYRLLRVVQPARAVVPSEMPIPRPPEGEAAKDEGEGSPGDFRTPGDLLRPRWETEVRPEPVMREWADGDEVVRGTLEHGAKGEATATFAPLAPGAYRLRYETLDDFGARCEAAQEFVVAGPASILALPLLLRVEESSVAVGGTARILAASGLPDQPLTLEIWRKGRLDERREIAGGKDVVIEIPVTERERGGFGLALCGVRDHQFFRATASVMVPWDDKELSLEFTTFRDRLRPGAKETFSIRVKTPDGRPAEAGAAELLAYMYDRSLDLFAPHHPLAVASLYPVRTSVGWVQTTLSQARAFWVQGTSRSRGEVPSFQPDRLKFFDRYGIGGPGFRGGALGMPPPAPMMAQSMPRPAAAAPMRKSAARLDENAPADSMVAMAQAEAAAAPAPAPPEPQPAAVLRSDFSETAFWRPSLLTGPDGTAVIEFTVPDSVTAWNVWVHAVTKDLKGTSVRRETRSVKELMVRPYLPRFLREGDAAELKVVVNNASESERTGMVTLDVVDPETNQSLASAFGLEAAASKPFRAPAGGGANVVFSVRAPKALRLAAFRVTASSGPLSDGELRPVPVLPGRLHLVQSRFVTLKNRSTKTMTFADLAKGDDPTRTNEQLVVTVDAQLFTTVLEALPYLVDFPYECTEQTLNRFVSTGIVSSLYASYPAVGKLAAELAKRTTPLETWDQADPNRKMALEESPWLRQARGGQDAGHGLTNVLDPRVAKANRDSALEKLRKAQNANGSFPWWPGGPPSPHMTLYLMHGLANAAEFGVDVPKEMVQRGWQYLAGHFRSDLRKMMADECCAETLTFLNYVASSYPDESWVNGALTPAERKEILAFSFKRWKQHSPYLKGLLALTLKRMGRPGDAKLVWDSVMDSAKTNDELGTSWAPEDRSWLWYNDTVETQAFALRTLTELGPADPRREGLVQWLLLNKKLNQWKSTRATAEVLYSLAHYLKKEGALGVREDATVTVGGQKVTFTFEPDRYTGKKNQVVVPGEKVDPATMSTVTVSKESPGFAFASAAWHFATDRLPAEERGDFFHVSRSYFKRVLEGKEWVLRPLADGAPVAVGDQVEVHLTLRTKHAAEYVHLRDPRGAGFEPENPVSRHRWNLGVAWYEEIRDSGTNFFFETLPAGEYPFTYRIRAATAGTFRVGPATVQSMYAPEFNAYSTGQLLVVKGE